ncbi:MAG: phage tail assembly chaperone [Oceanicaulis sp.]|uniref:phage tail assembly chaperone n=1 Tax=Glycocaulis sp. TaxID=1969725 RepID=UPI0025C6CF1E|nr:phage tail assembly chaperone [Glycocaulis sp.]MCC5980355.1 phage tail assembly chaperone [Oceanicaulis sp.]MCH8522225.1 phage tail assembly chaperone [Glycocaulis sp.]
MSPRWQARLVFGVVRLGLSPSEFWALSLPEWLALVRAVSGASAAPISRSDLTALMARFPDQKDAQP